MSSLLDLHGMLSGALTTEAPARWSGVDETVVGRIASEAGRAPWRSLLDVDHGDLLLFVFLCAGIAGGFALGYGYRLLFIEQAGVPTVRKAKGAERSGKIGADDHAG